MRRAAEIVADVEASLDAAFLIGGRGARNIVTLRIAADHRRHGYTTENIDKVIHEMRRRAWRAIVERLELRRMMSIKRWEALDEQLDKDEWPELTEANVAAFAKQFVVSLDEMLDEAIDEVFNWLRPHECTDVRTNYKTNSKFELGPKVVISYAVQRQWRGGATGLYEIQHDRQQKFVALENVFNALDGHGQIAKSHFSMLSNALKDSPTGIGETPLFAFRAFKNGNLHLAFRRMDLVAELNRRAGGRNLKPSREAA